MENLLDVLEYFSKDKKEIILLGHDNPDCDSIISAFLMSKLLEYKGILNKIIVPTEIDDETRNLLSFFKNNDFFNNLDNYKGIIEGSDVVLLLDHNKTNYQCNIIGCLDHHPTTDLFNYDYYVNKPSSSTAKIVFHLMEKYNYPITKEIIEIVCFSIFIDTCSLKSTKCPEEDKVWVLDCIKKWGLDYETLYNKGLITTNLNTSMCKITQNGIKKYCFKDVNVWSSYIQINNNCDDYLINSFVKFINYSLFFENVKLWVFLVIDFHNDKTIEYRITYNNLDIIVHNGIKSRGTDIIPNIQKNIETIIKNKGK